MKNILIATDLTVNCDRAMERAIKIATLFKAQLHILHIASPYRLSENRMEAPSARQDKEDLVRSVVLSYAGIDAIETKIYIIESSNAFAEIIDASLTCKADLIVMGVHNKRGFKDLFVGTTIERVIRKGIKPVLMVSDKPQDDYKSIVIGCDFSDSSAKALEISIQIAPKSEAKIIHAFDFPNTSIGAKIELHAGDVLMNKEHELLEKFVEENKNILKKHSFSHEQIREEPFSALVNVVKKQKADLLAIGVNSRSGIITTKIGGVAEEILATPPCDVLVIK